MRGHPGHNERPHARLPPSFLGMEAWMTSQLNQLWFGSYVVHLSVWHFLFWHIRHGCLYNRVLAVDRSTDAGIKCPYCIVHNVPYAHTLEEPSLMAVLSLAPPLTARCLSPLPGFESRHGHVRELPVTWGLAVVFAGYSGFLYYLQLASHELATVGINVTITEIPNAHSLASLALIAFFHNKICVASSSLKPSSAETTFVQSTRMERFLVTI